MSSMTKIEVARAFVERKPGRCHNASTGGDIYTLHSSPIAVHEKRNGCQEGVGAGAGSGDAVVVFFWHGHYTATTASHMNTILHALGASFRVSYAEARKTGATTFVWFV